ncbi:hypothetical protein [Streptomyces sp. NPDC060194]|uniref:hypothetical protein n=1 Tax=Streptomyces sp. NPDC060194 TaxID=3347069 RepID=UPI00364BF4D7
MSPSTAPPADAVLSTPGEELGLQELEAREAPGFWTGYSAGPAVSSPALDHRVASGA